MRIKVNHFLHQFIRHPIMIVHLNIQFGSSLIEQSKTFAFIMFWHLTDSNPYPPYNALQSHVLSSTASQTINHKWKADYVRIPDDQKQNISLRFKDNFSSRCTKKRPTKCSSGVVIKVVTSAIMTKITKIDGGSTPIS